MEIGYLKKGRIEVYDPFLYEIHHRSDIHESISIHLFNSKK
jgi:hypothetical protein